MKYIMKFDFKGKNGDEFSVIISPEYDYYNLVQIGGKYGESFMAFDYSVNDLCVYLEDVAEEDGWELISVHGDRKVSSPVVSAGDCVQCDILSDQAGRKGWVSLV